MDTFIDLGENIALLVAFTFIYGLLRRFLELKSRGLNELIHSGQVRFFQ